MVALCHRIHLAVLECGIAPEFVDQLQIQKQNHISMRLRPEIAQKKTVRRGLCECQQF